MTRATLVHTLGLSAADQDWALVGALPETAVEIGDDASLLLRAVDERLDVRIAASELEGAQQEIRRQYRAIFPSVSLGVDVERTERRAPKSLPFNPLGNLPVTLPVDQAQSGREFVRDYVADRIDAKRDRDLEKRQNIDLLLGSSLQVTLPIWDQNRAQIAKARYKALQRKKACEELLESVIEDIQRATAVFRSAGELALLFAGESLPLAQKNVETARRTYGAGEESILALIEAQKSLIQQREAYVGVLKDRAVALVYLERALGGRLRACEEIPQQTTESVLAPALEPALRTAQPAQENGRAAVLIPREAHDE